VEPDIRDDVISWIRYWSERLTMKRRNLIKSVGISVSKFYDWCFHYGEVRLKARPFNGWWGISDEEEQAIVRYRLSHEFAGYRRLCYQMLDENIVAVSPATVYRVLKKYRLLSRWNEVKESGKGRGFTQPSMPHQHWHVDISYVKVQCTFYFLVSVLDGFSRYIVHSELRVHMEEFDVEVVVQRALEKYPEAKPRIISDNGSQFISRDFKSFLGEKELTHVRTSVRYPQSNGKIESFHKTIKRECIRKKSLLDLKDARKIIDGYIEDYNCIRLHSSINYLSPRDVLEGRKEQRLREREEKLRRAKEKRKQKALANRHENKYNVISVEKQKKCLREPAIFPI
jgi:transposase InsO family protein